MGLAGVAAIVGRRDCMGFLCGVVSPQRFCAVVAIVLPKPLGCKNAVVFVVYPAHALQLAVGDFEMAKIYPALEWDEFWAKPASGIGGRCSLHASAQSQWRLPGALVPRS